MNREDLISKWLDNNLNPQELEAFKKLEDYDDLIRLNNGLQNFKPEYNTKIELNNLMSSIKKEQRTQQSWFKPFLKIAALLAICFSIYYYTTTIDTTVTTQLAQKTEVSLPDTSSVSLNAKSYLVYNKKSWHNNRTVTLKGEAFFKVAKGSSFNVVTDTGKVTVYGTEFNVIQRHNYFEVICYEGLVGVTYNSQETKLKPGDSFLILDGKIIAKEKETRQSPSWLNNESEFKSIPFKQVIKEFERQYDVAITLKDIDSTKLFTGKFTHNDIDIALKSIAVPLNLMYLKDNKSIVLKRE